MRNNCEACIYVVTHKEFVPPENNIYIPIEVGSSLRNYRINNTWLSDNAEENISLKNKSFCELTALYWIWKNDKYHKYIGIVHYRRYFVSKRMGRLNDVLNYHDVETTLLKNDIILTKKHTQDGTIFYDYKRMHFAKDYLILGEVIKDIYPEYFDDFLLFSNQNQLHICNMMITSKIFFDQYCEWLFNILFEVERRVDISDYDEKQIRIFGYMAERLLNVWVLHNKLKVFESPIYITEETIPDKIKSFVYAILKKTPVDTYELMLNRKLRIKKDNYNKM